MEEERFIFFYKGKPNMTMTRAELLEAIEEMLNILKNERSQSDAMMNLLSRRMNGQ